MNNIDDILNNTDLYVLAKNIKGEYIYCNEKYAEFLNLDSPMQIIGKTDHDFFPKEMVSIYLAGDKQVFAGRTLWNLSEKIQFSSSISILINKAPIKNNTGITGVVASFVENKNSSNELSSYDLMFYDVDTKRYYFEINKHKEYFTELEYSIFKQLFLGLSCKQIAIRIELSPRTVESYISTIKRKLQCSHKNEIIETAIRYGITHSCNIKRL